MTGTLNINRLNNGRTDVLKFFVTRFLSLSIIVGIATRVVLLFNHSTIIGFTAVEWIRIFGLGLVNDICFSMLALIPFFIIYLGFTESKYKPTCGIIIELLLLASVVYVFFFNSIFKQYGGAASKAAQIFLTYKFISFTLRFFLPHFRDKWRYIEINVLLFVYILCTLFNFIGEYFFWNEFGVRYNFIAVDYLVYTNEVIGNILQSYNIIPIFTGLILVTTLVYWLLRRHHNFELRKIWNWKTILIQSGIYIIILPICYLIIHFTFYQVKDENVYVTELENNGGFSFIEAFRSSTLDFSKFYPMMPREQCAQELSKLNGGDADNMQIITDSVPAVKKNIVLITVESLSGSFLKAYGNNGELTPFIDSLMTRSLVLDNLYATGNRTVRGLEALTLCIPPGAGESIIKKPDNANLFSTGSVLKRMGYSVQFMYGGEAYFDNMAEFYGSNGYQLFDESNLSKDEITFSNIWGVCDEDLFKLAIKTFDKNATSGKPFFTHIMTVSNHRPYTFPEGKITLKSGDLKSREGAVKYTDFAIGQFLKNAATKPWFKNTIFIIVADHCASSAGDISIPIENYHIPAIIYAPGYVRPQHVSEVCSQIDIMPTVFSLLHFSYKSYFYGKNVLSSNFHPRAFMATYQDLGYLDNDTLTVLSPTRRVNQFSVKPEKGFTFKETPITQPGKKQVLKAEVYYQSANLYFKRIK
jgi:phosphoglycerol transferase MdoB-like AlkP superfamily enzyme